MATARLQAGQPLPTLVEMADELGVSEIVTRRAVRRLTREGLLIARPGAGIRVADAREPGWLAHVLLAHWSGPAMYYFSVMAGRLAERLHQDRVLLTTLQLVPAAEAQNYPTLRAILATRSIDLCLVDGAADGIGRLVRSAGIALVERTDREPSPAAARSLRTDRDAAWAVAAEHCRRCGLRRAAVVGGSRRDRIALGAAHALQAAGLDPQLVPAPARYDLTGSDAVEVAGLDAMDRFLSRRAALPDAFVFTDDYCARGGLQAMGRHGVRAPEDVQVVTWSNRGNGPVYVRALTRLEMDPAKHGETAARVLLDVLDRGAPAPGLVPLQPELVLGETTRPVPVTPGRGDRRRPGPTSMDKGRSFDDGGGNGGRQGGESLTGGAG
jgi:DNA-binding LacI/PurR family transcriptional regulator